MKKYSVTPDRPRAKKREDDARCPCHRQRRLPTDAETAGRTLAGRMLSDGSWRKRVGVEPTKNRLAALSGFEGQPLHRERFPSIRDDRLDRPRCHPAAGAAPEGR